MVEGKFPAEQDLTSLDLLVDRTVDLFHGQETIKFEGTTQAYTLSAAALNAIEEHLSRRIIDSFQLVGILRNQSTLTPKLLDSDELADLNECDSWDNYFNALAVAIIVSEAVLKHEGVREEDNRWFSET